MDRNHTRSRFFSVLLIVFLVAAAFFFASFMLSGSKAKPEERAESGQETKTEETKETGQAAADTAEREEEVLETAADEPHILFFIKEKDGYLDVYLADGVTLYMTTGIRPEDLEDDFVSQSEEGIAIYSMESLYDFLESYSS